MNKSPPHRRVRIVQDRSGVPLWYLRCASPCEGRRQFCMEFPHGPDCYLSGGLSEASARTIANMRGYEVVET